MTLTASAVTPAGLVSVPGCVQDTIYKRGMRVVWRFQVFDIDRGKQLTPNDSANVQIRVQNINPIQASFTPIGGQPSNPWTWVAAWTVPEDYPLGLVPYTIVVATPDGRLGNIAPASYGNNAPQIVA
jgi:hypothetical protein